MSITGIRVPLVGQDGNAFAIIGRVANAMRSAGVDADVIAHYQDDATSWDYNHLLATTLEYVNDGRQDNDMNKRRWQLHREAMDAGDCQCDIDAEDDDCEDDDYGDNDEWM